MTPPADLTDRQLWAALYAFRAKPGPWPDDEVAKQRALDAEWWSRIERLSARGPRKGPRLATQYMLRTFAYYGIG